MSHDAADTQVPQKWKNAHFTLSADVVMPALARSVERGSFTQYQADLIKWFFALCREEDWTVAQAARELGYDSPSTLWKIFNGAYEAKPDNICAQIEKFKKLYTERAGYRDPGFIDTSIAKRIFQVCNAAMVSQTIAFIFGDSQIGKTRALVEYQRRNNHGQTKYVRMPASAGVQLVAKEIARACYVSPRTSFENMRDSILRAVDAQTLMIIDEGHQAFLSYQRSSQVKVFEFLREIYDRTNCGMVICGTNVLRDEMQTGRLALMLKQLDRRGIIRVSLPAAPPQKDIDAVARSFGLEPAEGDAAEIVKDMIHVSGLGKFVKFLQAASSLASKEGKRLSWDHYVRAHDIIAKLSRGAT